MDNGKEVGIIAHTARPGSQNLPGMIFSPSPESP